VIIQVTDTQQQVLHQIAVEKGIKIEVLVCDIIINFLLRQDDNAVGGTEIDRLAYRAKLQELRKEFGSG